MKWVRDTIAEPKLKQMGYELEVQTDYQLSNIDIETSKANQSRAGRYIKDDSVLSYGQLMQSPGATFKMPILNVIKRCPVIVLSGLHRVCAAELVGLPKIDAYVMHLTRPIDLDLIPRIINCWESNNSLAKDEKLTNVAFMIEHYSMELKEAAAKFGVPYSWINTFMRQNAVAAQVAEVGVQPDSISRALLTKLSPLQDNVKIFAATTRFIVKNNVVGNAAEQFIEEVRKGKTEAAQLAIVDKWEQAINKQQAKERTPIKTPVRTRFKKLLSLMRLCLEANPTVGKLQLQPKDFQDITSDWQIIDRIMGKMIRGDQNGK